MKRLIHPLAILLAAAFCLSSCTSFRTVHVPMRDGTPLATDCHIPRGAGPFPTVVSRTVYGRGGMEDWAKTWNDMGVAFVSQDTRGRGDSQGRDMAFVDDGWGTNQDGADTMTWVRQQPWCDGKTGMFGPSALSIVQALAAGADPAITCQAIWVGSSNFYGQLSYQGGVFRKALCENWLRGQNSFHVVDLWHAHPTYDAFWQGFDSELAAPRVNTPAVHIGGWWDIFAQGTINNFTTRQHMGDTGARGKQKLVMGPWLHGPVRDAGDVRLPENFDDCDFTALTTRFFRHWLLGEDNGVMDEPAVHYYTMGDFSDPRAPGNEWRTADDWPPFPTTETSFFLGQGGRLAADPAEKGSITFAFDPKNPCPTLGGANLTIPAGPFDQRPVSARKDVVRFETAPLERPMEITGRISVRLFVSTDAPDTDFTAKLVDIYPDGREILMLDGIRRLKFRNGYAQSDPLSPGEVGELEIDLWSISLIVNTGHRIGLQVSSSNYPRFEINPNTGQDFPGENGELRLAHNTIHVGGEYASALLLPVRPE